MGNSHECPPRIDRCEDQGRALIDRAQRHLALKLKFARTDAASGLGARNFQTEISRQRCPAEASSKQSLASASDKGAPEARRTAPLHPEGEVMLVLEGFYTAWCGREDSNFHGLSPTTTSTLRVYQFRHDRKIDRGLRKRPPRGRCGPLAKGHAPCKRSGPVILGSWPQPGFQPISANFAALGTSGTAWLMVTLSPGARRALGRRDFPAVDDPVALVAQHDQDRRQRLRSSADIGHCAARTEEFGAVGQLPAVLLARREIEHKVALAQAEGRAAGPVPSRAGPNS